MTVSKWLLCFATISMMGTTASRAEEAHANAKNHLGEHVSDTAQSKDITKDGSFGKDVRTKAKAEANAHGLAKSAERPEGSERERPEVSERERPEVSERERPELSGRR